MRQTELTAILLVSECEQVESHCPGVSRTKQHRPRCDEEFPKLVELIKCCSVAAAAGPMLCVACIGVSQSLEFLRNRSLHTHGIAVLRVTAPCHIVSGNQVYGETQLCPSSGYNLAKRPVIRV